MEAWYSVLSNSSTNEGDLGRKEMMILSSLKERCGVGLATIQLTVPSDVPLRCFSFQSVFCKPNGEVYRRESVILLSLDGGHLGKLALIN